MPHLRQRCTLGTKLRSWYFLRCTMSSCFCWKCSLQSRQENGFSPVCVHMCAFKPRFWGESKNTADTGWKGSPELCIYYCTFLPQEWCGPYQSQGLLHVRASGLSLATCEVVGQPGLQETCPKKPKAKQAEILYGIIFVEDDDELCMCVYIHLGGATGDLRVSALLGLELCRCWEAILVLYKISEYSQLLSSLPSPNLACTLRGSECELLPPASTSETVSSKAHSDQSASGCG